MMIGNNYKIIWFVLGSNIIIDTEQYTNVTAEIGSGKRYKGKFLSEDRRASASLSKLTACGQLANASREVSAYISHLIHF
jgi:hypothetical protein